LGASVRPPADSSRRTQEPATCRAVFQTEANPISSKGQLEKKSQLLFCQQCAKPQSAWEDSVPVLFQQPQFGLGQVPLRGGGFEACKRPLLPSPANVLTVSRSCFMRLWWSTKAAVLSSWFRSGHAERAAGTPTRCLPRLDVKGRLKTSHLWAPQNQPVFRCV